MLTEHQERHAAALAARPVDADGHPLCACGAILDGPSVDCEDCRGRRHEREIERSMLANNRHAALDHLSARWAWVEDDAACLLYTSPSPRDRTRYRMPSSA